MSKSVLIAGAGIAGSTAAYWLARTGWQVTVVEKAAAVRSSGNPIDVRGEAAAVARGMGVWDQLQQAATQVDRLVLVDSLGRPRAALATRQNNDPEQEVEVPRVHLAAALLNAARGEAHVVTGDWITGVTQDAAGVDVSFAHGAPRRFDLVIGADGLHSSLRSQVFGPEQQFGSSFGMYVGTMHTRIVVESLRELRLFNRPGISLSVHPGADNPLVAFIFRSNARYDRHDPKARKRMIEQAYRGRGWISDQAVDEWLSTEDVYFDSVTRITMPTWTAGRISLLGDAADCISLLGEGSSNAIVAAKALADALAANTARIPDGLASYERTHRFRLAAAHRKAGANSRFLVPATSLGLRVRNATLRAAALRTRLA